MPTIRMDAAASLSVSTGHDVSATVRRLVSEDVPRRLAAADAGLWGPEAADEASIRLGWLDTFERSRHLPAELAELREGLIEDGIRHVVLAGMGGSSLAPEVICRTLDVPLTVVDTTDPEQVTEALRLPLNETVVVVSSKSGGTVETDSLRRSWVQAFTDAGIKDFGKHVVVVTDPGSPLEQLGTAMGAKVFLADANVGGRYSALTAFGLVPAALAGVDVATLLDEAAAFADTIVNPAGENPALLLGALLAERQTVTIAEDGTGIVGLGDWAEQLIAESTGKNETGILPVVVETPTARGARTGEVLSITVGGATPHTGKASSLEPPDVAVNGPLGAQFLCWELATAYAGHLLGINPFDQPNVAESKDNTKRILETGVPDEQPVFEETGLLAYGTRADNLVDALRSLVDQVGEDGYLAVMAYLDRSADHRLAGMRESLASTTTAPITFGWGPRFLHSTGQFHKGGRQTGVFLQITADSGNDVEVPGRPYGFADLIAAQAAGDRKALRDRQRPLLWLHLRDRAIGVDAILAAAKEIR